MPAPGTAYVALAPTDTDDSSPRQPYPSSRDIQLILPRVPMLDRQMSSSHALCESDPQVLEQELARIKSQLEEVQLRADDLDMSYKTRMTPIRQELEELRNEEVDKQVHLDLLLNPPEDLIPVVGPRALQFVDGDRFQFVCIAVIAANMTAMVSQIHFPDAKGTYWVLDQFFLVFYTVELLMRAVLHRRALLVGKPSVVWWHWLDLSIVCAGMLD